MMSLETAQEVFLEKIRPGDRVRLISKIEMPLEMSRRGSEAAERRACIPAEAIGIVIVPPAKEGNVSLYVLFKGLESIGKCWVSRHLMQKIAQNH